MARRMRRHCLTKHAYKQYYERQYRAQGGTCAVCWRRKRLVVDHCQVQGTLRGLLCNGCNAALGVFDHDVDILQAAIDYLNTTQLHTPIAKIRAEAKRVEWVWLGPVQPKNGKTVTKKVTVPIAVNLPKNKPLSEASLRLWQLSMSGKVTHVRRMRDGRSVAR